MKACPVCRTIVTSITFLSNGLPLPLALVTPKLLPDRPHRLRPDTADPNSNFRESVRAEIPTNLRSRRSMPSLVPLRDHDTASISSRTASTSSIGVATQAQSSVRSRPLDRQLAFHRIRQSATQLPALSSPSSSTRPLYTPRNAPHTVSQTSTVPHTIPTIPSARQNIVLIGHSRKILVSLAQRLLATFPPVDGSDIASRSKSTLYINGQLIRLVLIECPIFAIGPDLIARVQRQSPKLVLLCADYFNISSFESIVRIDMEILDYLNLTCVWVLVKSTNRPKASNIVDDSDVSTANHFLGTSRKCFVAPIDGALQNVALRKFGYFIFTTLTQHSTSTQLPPTLASTHSGIPLRSMSFFCLRPDKRKRREREQTPSRSTTNLARWLW